MSEAARHGVGMPLDMPRNTRQVESDRAKVDGDMFSLFGGPGRYRPGSRGRSEASSYPARLSRQALDMQPPCTCLVSSPCYEVNSGAEWNKDTRGSLREDGAAML